MRRRWKELEVQAASGQEAIKALQDKNMALETKLKHARLGFTMVDTIAGILVFVKSNFLICKYCFRNQIEVEINKRKRVEKDRDTYVGSVAVTSVPLIILVFPFKL